MASQLDCRSAVFRLSLYSFAILYSLHYIIFLSPIDPTNFFVKIIHSAIVIYPSVLLAESFNFQRLAELPFIYSFKNILFKVINQIYSYCYY